MKRKAVVDHFASSQDALGVESSPKPFTERMPTGTYRDTKVLFRAQRRLVFDSTSLSAVHPEQKRTVTPDSGAADGVGMVDAGSEPGGLAGTPADLDVHMI